MNLEKAEKVVKIIREWTDGEQKRIAWSRRFDLDSPDAVDDAYTAEVLGTRIGVANRILVEPDKYGRISVDAERQKLPSFTVYDRDTVLIEMSEKSGVKGIDALLLAVKRRFLKVETFFNVVIEEYDRDLLPTSSDD